MRHLKAKILSIIAPMTLIISPISFAEKYGSEQYYDFDYNYNEYPAPKAGGSDEAMPSQAKGGLSDREQREIDAATTSSIKERIAADPLLKGCVIDISTTSNSVTLMGEVDTDMQFEKVVTIASSIESIDNVNTQGFKIKSSEALLDDLVLTAKVKGELVRTKFFKNKDIAYWPLKIETKNGIVYVSGTVESESQKTNALNVVGAVKGIKDIQASIEIQPATDTTENKIE